MFAPANTPHPILEKLHDEVTAIITQPDVKAQFAGLGIEPKPSTLDAFTPFVAKEVAKWSDLVRKAGIDAQ